MHKEACPRGGPVRPEQEKTVVPESRRDASWKNPKLIKHQVCLKCRKAIHRFNGEPEGKLLRAT